MLVLCMQVPAVGNGHCVFVCASCIRCKQATSSLIAILRQHYAGCVLYNIQQSECTAVSRCAANVADISNLNTTSSEAERCKTRGCWAHCQGLLLSHLHHTSASGIAYQRQAAGQHSTAVCAPRQVLRQPRRIFMPPPRLCCLLHPHATQALGPSYLGMAAVAHAGQLRNQSWVFVMLL